MRLGHAWLCALVFCSLMWACASVTVAEGRSDSGIGGDFAKEPPLVVARAQWLLGEQLAAAEAARRANPLAVVIRERSATAFRGLTATSARKLADEAFTGLIDARAGGPPKLPAGQRIRRFASAEVAQIDLGASSKANAILQSSQPMAMQTSPRHWRPLDLGLHRSGKGFVGASTLVPARLPEHLSEGAQLPSVGLSITPVDAHGRPLTGSAGTIDGASVFMANTERDSDTVLKLSTYGVAVETLLRSADSPDRLFFRARLPAGAHLKAASDGSGSVMVVEQGAPVAKIPTPSAVDAAGDFVPVHVSVTGETIALTVKRRAGAFRYPIAVDPEFNVITESKVESKDWPFHGQFSVKYEFGEATIWTTSYSSGQYGAIVYQTKGVSQIYQINATNTFSPTVGNGTEYWLAPGTGEDYIEFHEPNGTSHGYTVAFEEVMRLKESPVKSEVCAETSVPPCPPERGQGGNAVEFVERAKANNSASFSFTVRSATVAISQPKETHSTASYNTSSPELEYTSGGKLVKTPNVMYNGGWIGPNSGAFEYTVRDLGLGVSASNVEVYKGTTWWKPISHNFLSTGSCVGVQCAESQKETVTYSMLSSYLVNGNDTMRVSANDPMSKTSSSEHGEGEATLKVDNAVPHGFVISGLATKGGTLYEIDESATSHLLAEVSDGEGATPSSGIKSITLGIDGRQIGAPGGKCSPGPCAAKGEWSINGGELGAGIHTVTLVATDNAGNVATSPSYSLYVYHAGAAHVGPGTANLESGNYSLTATDVNMSGGMGGLTVTRSYQSRNPQAGAGGPLGSQWKIGLGSGATLEVEPNGSVLLVGSDSGVLFVKKASGGFESPFGDGSLTLEAVEQAGKITAYLLKNAAKGTTTRYTLPSGSEEWLPTVSEGPNATTTTTDEYSTSEPEPGKKIVRPILEVAPHPSATCAFKKLEKGCRALEFNYAESTTATGEGQSEWGDYKGNLTRVYLVAWDPATKEMKTTTVAQYAYDSKGRLRAVWDPRISPALKTVYGYDAEGHVTALTPAGEESWAFTYGTIAGDATSGRLLKATRAPSTAPLWAGTSPSNTDVPMISGTPVVDNRLSVSDGIWSGSPVAYAYQWERCNAEGGQCTPITGATNASYTTTSSDLGHALRVKATATNGGGSAVASSGPTVAISATVGTSSQSIDPGSSLNAVSCVPKSTDCVVTDSKGNAFYTLEALKNSASSWHPWSGPGVSGASKAVTCPSVGLCLMAAGATGSAKGGSLYYATSFGGSWTLAYSPAYGVEAIACPSTSFCVDGQEAGGYFRYSTSPASTSWPLEQQGTSEQTGVACTSSSFCVISDSTGSVRVATSTAQIESSSWTVTKVDGTTPLTGVACLSTSSCTAIDGSGNAISLTVASGGTVTAIAHHIDETNKLTGISCPERSTCVAVDNVGNIFTSYDGGQSWSKLYNVNTKFTGLSCSGTNVCVAVDSVGTVSVFSSSPVSQSIDSGSSLNSIGCIESSNVTSYCLTSDSKGNVLYANVIASPNVTSWTQWTGPGASPSQAIYCQVASLCLMAAGKAGSGGDLYYATSIGGAWSLGYSPSYGVDALSCVSASLCVAAQSGVGYFRYSTEPASTNWYLEQQGTAAQKGVSCLWTDFCAMVDSAGTVRVATNAAQLESSTWTETKVDGSTALNGISCISAVSCVAVDNAGAVLQLALSSGQATATKHVIDSGHSLTAVSCASSSSCTAVDNAGNMFFSSNSGATWRQEDHFGAGLTSVFCSEVSSFCLATDTAGNVDKLSGRTQYEGQARTAQPGLTLDYNVPVSGSGAPNALGGAEAAKWGQADLPVTATAVFPADEPQTWPATDYKRATLYYMDSHARTTNIGAPGGAVSTVEYNEQNEGVRTLSAANRAQALEEGAKSAEVAKLLDSETVYRNEGAQLAETLGPQHMVKIANGNEKVPSGSEVLARDHVKYFYDEGAPGTGELYDLVTKTTDGALTAGGEEVDVRTTTKSYSGQSNLGWKLRSPTSITIDPAGLKLTHTTVYDEATGAVVETRGAASPGPGDPHDTLTIYYSAGANSSHPACGEHIEWAGLVCETLPGKQPGTSGVAPLAVTTYAYDLLDQAEVITEAFGSVTRTKKTTFDAAGRPLTSEVTSTNGATPVPAVTNGYDEKTGALVKRSEVFEGTEKVVKTAYDKLGRIQGYEDADGAYTSYAYDIDNRPTSMTESTELFGTVRGRQTYSYDPVSGLLSELADSAAGKFTATYDVAGRMTSQTYPNKMTAVYATNTAGETTGIEYVKSAYCATGCPETWSSDTIVPGIHGEVVKESGTLAEEPKIAYDAAGRLTEVQEIPAGEGCTTRVYAYDAESNRTALTTRAPGAEGKCATEGGTVETHTYDSGNRLTDGGVTYGAIGNITYLPAADAGGSGMAVSSTYYVDSQLATQTQNGTTTSYYMDPESRLREARTPAVSVTHYAGPGQAVAWISEPESKWTRDIPGLDGSLVGTQASVGGVTLMVHDLQGNAVGTAALDEKQTKLLTTYKSTEFGVPTQGTPPKYSWLGALGITSESPTGLVVQGGVAYVPQTGQPLQTSGIALPLPDNVATPYEMKIANWVIEDAEAVMRQRTEAEEAARKAAEAATESAQEAFEEEGEWEEEPNFVVNDPIGGGGGGGGEATMSSVWDEVEEATKDLIEVVESEKVCEAFGAVAGGAGGLLLGPEASPETGALAASAAASACAIGAINDLNKYNAAHADVLQGKYWTSNVINIGRRRLHRECSPYSPVRERIWVWSKYRPHGKHHVKIYWEVPD